MKISKFTVTDIHTDLTFVLDRVYARDIVVVFNAKRRKAEMLILHPDALGALPASDVLPLSEMHHHFGALRDRVRGGETVRIENGLTHRVICYLVPVASAPQKILDQLTGKEGLYGTGTILEA